jgi:hypothetical protein
MVMYNATIAQGNIRTDKGVGANRNVFTQFSTALHNGGGMNKRSHV